MITNQRQYAITRTQLARFEEALAQQAVSTPRPGVHPRIDQAMQDATASEVAELRAQLARYDELRSGRVAKRTLSSLRELPVALVEGRIAARLTQRELGRATRGARATGSALGSQHLFRCQRRSPSGHRRRARCAFGRNRRVRRSYVTFGAVITRRSQFRILPRYSASATQASSKGICSNNCQSGRRFRRAC